MRSHLDAFARDLRGGTREGLVRAVRRAYLLALLALAVPGVLLGGLSLLSHASSVPAAAWLALLALALALALLALHLARRAAQNAAIPARQAALTGAIQAATAPGVPLLLACAALGQPLFALAFAALAAGLHALTWAQLPGWVREPEGEAPAEGAQERSEGQRV